MSNDDSNVFASFMSTSKNEKGNLDKSIISSNKTQEALDKKKEEDEEAKKKELEDAKKESMAKAKNYSQANLMRAQTIQLIRMAPILILFGIILIIILYKGGDWLQAGLHKLILGNL